MQAIAFDNEDDASVLATITRAREAAPDIPEPLWRELTLVLQAWNVTQHWFRAPFSVESVVDYARWIAALSASITSTAEPQEPGA
jgi:hypothetical protein